jgi:hypothetical protein
MSERKERDMNRKLIVLGLIASFAGPIGAIAGPFTDFEHDLRDAYGQYRTALFQSNQGNADDLGQDPAAAIRR